MKLIFEALTKHELLEFIAKIILSDKTYFDIGELKQRVFTNYIKDEYGIETDSWVIEIPTVKHISFNDLINLASMPNDNNEGITKVFDFIRLLDPEKTKKIKVINILHMSTFRWGDITNNGHLLFNITRSINQIENENIANTYILDSITKFIETFSTDYADTINQHYSSGLSPVKQIVQVIPSLTNQDKERLQELVIIRSTSYQAIYSRQVYTAELWYIKKETIKELMKELAVKNSLDSDEIEFLQTKYEELLEIVED